MDCSPSASSVLRFHGQEYWNGLPFPSPGDLPNPGIKHTFAALAGGFFTTEPLGKPGSEGRVLLTGLSRIRHQGGPRRAETSLGPWEFGGSSQEAEPPPTPFFFFFF